MLKMHVKKAIMIIEVNDSKDILKSASLSVTGDLEYGALGETEAGKKVMLVPVVLGDNGIEFIGVDFIVWEREGVNYARV
jgi:hypothetical protein